MAQTRKRIYIIGTLAVAGVAGWLVVNPPKRSVVQSETQSETTPAALAAPKGSPFTPDSATQRSNAIQAVLDPMSVVPAAIRPGFNAVLSETDPIRRAALLDELLKSLPPKELILLLNALPKGGGPPGVSDEILRRLALADPTAAAQWVVGVAEPDLRQSSFRQLGVVWAGKDLDGAIAWAMTLTEGADRNVAIHSIAYEASRTNPKQALEFILDLPAGIERDDLVIHAAKQWATKEPASAASWAELIDDADLRTRALADIASAWSATDPEAAANYAIAAIPPGRDQSRAAIEILQRWVAVNPSPATTWAASFPDGELQEIALRTTVGTWAGREPVAAAEWIGKLPPGANKDQAIGAYSVALAETDPAAAIRWAEMLPEGDVRNNRTYAVAKRWLDLNPAAARSWIEKSPLSDTQKNNLFAPPIP